MACGTGQPPELLTKPPPSTDIDRVYAFAKSVREQEGGRARAAVAGDKVKGLKAGCYRRSSRSGIGRHVFRRLERYNQSRGRGDGASLIMVILLVLFLRVRADMKKLYEEVPMRSDALWAEARIRHQEKMIKQIFGVCLGSIMREHQRD